MTAVLGNLPPVPGVSGFVESAALNQLCPVVWSVVTTINPPALGQNLHREQSVEELVDELPLNVAS